MASRLGQTMDQLRAARSEAEQALRAKQELVASVSHELRTPIAIVQAHLEAIDDACATGEGAVPAASLHAARREMERLTDLVDDLFTLARAGTDALKVQCVPTDVGAIVREVAASLGPLAQREGSLMLTANPRPASAPSPRGR